MNSCPECRKLLRGGDPGHACPECGLFSHLACFQRRDRCPKCKLDQLCFSYYEPKPEEEKKHGPKPKRDRDMAAIQEELAALREMVRTLRNSHTQLEGRLDTQGAREARMRKLVKEELRRHTGTDSKQIEALRAEVGETTRGLTAQWESIAKRVDDLETAWDAEAVETRFARDLERIVRRVREGDETSTEEVEKMLAARQLPDADTACLAHAAGLLHLRSGNANAALPHFQRAVQLAPDRSHAVAGVGLAMLELNHARDARVYLREAAEVFPHDAFIATAYALALYATDSVPDALYRLEGAIRLDPEAPGPQALLVQLGLHDGEGADPFAPVRKLLGSDS